MKNIVLTFILLGVFIVLSAEYVPQTLIFSSFDDIEIVSSYPDSLLTNCTWFNTFSSRYGIHYLEPLYEYQDSGINVYCYYMKYKDDTSIDAMIALLKAENKVTLAEPNHYCEFHNDPLIENQWSLPLINMDQVWNQYSYYGDDIMVGVVDSGIDLGLNDSLAVFYGQPHPDLVDNLYTDVNGHHGFNAYAFENAFEASEYNVQDELGHGTHVAGIIAGRKNNAYGMSGIAGGNALTNTNGSKIYSVKVGGSFMENVFPISAVIRGINRAHSDGVRIFNCSFGHPSPSQPGSTDQFQTLISELSNPDQDDPSLFICSAGNSGSLMSNDPAALPYTMSVAATTMDDSRAVYSSYHPSVDICAPGGMGAGPNHPSAILSTMPRDELFYFCSEQGCEPEFAYMSGTSMAAPMVTAAVVLTKQAHPTLSLPEIKQRIRGTADDISYQNPDVRYIGKLGAGRLNVLKAIETNAPHPTLRLQSVTVDSETYIPCGGQSMSLTIQLKNWWAPVQGAVSGTLFTSDGNIAITNNTLSFNMIPSDDYELFSATTEISDSSSFPDIARFSVAISYNGITETLYFSINRRIIISDSKINIPNRIAISDLVIDDMNMDGQDEIAFISEDSQNPSLAYVSLVKNGMVTEAIIDGGLECKPAFADMNHDGVKELVLFDGMGLLRIYDYNLNLLYVSSRILRTNEIKSFVVEDLNDDGQLDIVVAMSDVDNDYVCVLFFDDGNSFNFTIDEISLNSDFRIISPLAVGIVDNSPCNSILWVESNYNAPSTSFISTRLCKLTYHTRGSGFVMEIGQIDEVIAGNAVISSYGCTDLILNRPHPEEVDFVWAYVYVGIGYTRTNTIPNSDQTGSYKLQCIDFSGTLPSVVWTHNQSDNPLNVTQGAQKAYTIIVGDFIEHRLGNEILIGATEEIVDAETGEFIQYLTGNINHFLFYTYYSNNHYQPAVIIDYDSNGTKDVFVYKGGTILAYSANKVKSLIHDYQLPSNQTVRSIVAGNNRLSSIHDIYALTTTSQDTYIYYSPIIRNHEQLYYDWRQRNNNARKTCEFLQPLPAHLNSTVDHIWNHCELKQDTNIESDLRIFPGTRIKAQGNVRLNIFSRFTSMGTENNPITFSGICPNDVSSYWGGILVFGGASTDLVASKISNAIAAVDFYNHGDNQILGCEFSDNYSSIRLYQAFLDLQNSLLENSGTAITAHNNSEINLGYAHGGNRIIGNGIGIYSYQSTPYLDEGYNDLDNPGVDSWNIKSVSTPNGIKARYNWWGNDGNDPLYVESTLSNYREVEYQPFTFTPNCTPAKGCKTSSDFFMAELLRNERNWEQAIPLYHSVIQDSISSGTEKYLSVNGLFKCHKNLSTMNIHKDWLLTELNNSVDASYIAYLSNNLALANRSLGYYQDALNHYESILDNNPSYADSCYAVIDIGFTWLESEMQMQGKYPSLFPATLKDHLVITDELLTSILTSSQIHKNETVPIIPQIIGNYPNPFNPSTTIAYSIPQDGLVKIDVYNIKGQKVKQLCNTEMQRGHHKVVWDGKDKHQRSVSSGVYFVRLQANGQTSARKIMLMK